MIRTMFLLMLRIRFIFRINCFRVSRKDGMTGEALLLQLFLLFL